MIPLVSQFYLDGTVALNRYSLVSIGRPNVCILQSLIRVLMKTSKLLILFELLDFLEDNSDAGVFTR